MESYSKERLKLFTPFIVAVAAFLAVCMTLYMLLSHRMGGTASASEYGIYSQHPVTYATPGTEFGSFIVKLRPF